MLAVFFRRRWTACTTVFPHPITSWARLMFNLVRVGKEWVGPVIPHPITNNFRFYAYSWQDKFSWVIPHPLAELFPTLLTIWSKFSPPDNLLHKVDVLPCQDGERMVRPIFSPSPKKAKITYVMYSWQGKVGCVFLQTINHIHNSFLPPDNFLNKVDV